MTEGLSDVLRIESMCYRWPGAERDCLAIGHFAIARGETVFLHGPSGCGKSSLLVLIAGVQTARSGVVSLLGVDWAGLSPAARDRRRADHVGYIFQQFNLLPYLSAVDNVRLGVRYSASRQARAAPVRERAEDLLARCGVPRDCWRRAAGSLSVGQQQRVAAARALLGAPELILADEPTSSLDEALRDSLLDLLLELSAEAGSAVLFVSHDARLARRFGRVQGLPDLLAA